MRRTHTSATHIRAAFTLLIASALSAACDHDSPLAPVEVTPPVRVHGLVEVTITGLDTDRPTASAISASDVAALDRLRLSRDAKTRGLSLLTTAPENLNGTGDGTIQLEPLATGSFTDGVRGAGGYRYIHATFRVRNAQSDGTPYDTPRQNLTFLGTATSGTLGVTAISSLMHFDDGPADPGIATGILPTGSVARASDGTGIAPNGAGALQVLTEVEAATVLADAPAGVVTVFPYGFVVTSPASPGNRALPENPAPGQYDGVVTFAFRVPLQASAADDPFGITAVFIAVDDTEARVTESLEEQGTTNVQAGADALPGAGVTLLGNSATVVAGHGIRRVCRVRTAGADPLNPIATLVDAGAGCTAGNVSLPAHVRVVDIDAAPGGDGQSWATAFQFLQDAMACARDQTGSGQPCEGVSEIWVAEGEYHADEGAGQTDNDVGAQFELIEGVSLYGGFAGAEYGRDQRDWAAHPTILDGDIDGDGTTTGNSAIILSAFGTAITRTTTIDGFTVRRGFANGGSSGVLLCVALAPGNSCSPTLRNLHFTDNVTLMGTAIVIGNNMGVSAPLFDNVSFTNNTATSDGAAVHIFANAGTATPVFVRSTFTDNSGLAGAILVRRASGIVEVDIHGTTIRDNHTTGIVNGALSVRDGAVARLYNTELWNNTAVPGSTGAIRGTGSTVSLVNSTVFGHAQTAAAIIMSGGTLAVQNSIIHGDAPEPILFPTPPSAAVASYSVIDGGCVAALTACTNVIDGDPLFENAGAGDLRPGGGSPAINAGLNSLLPADPFDLDGDGDTAELLPFDVAGRGRVFDWGGAGPTPIVDMGAHERQ